MCSWILISWPLALQLAGQMAQPWWWSVYQTWYPDRQVHTKRTRCWARCTCYESESEFMWGRVSGGRVSRGRGYRPTLGRVSGGYFGGRYTSYWNAFLFGIRNHSLNSVKFMLGKIYDDIVIVVGFNVLYPFMMTVRTTKNRCGDSEQKLVFLDTLSLQVSSE